MDDTWFELYTQTLVSEYIHSASNNIIVKKGDERGKQPTVRGLRRNVFKIREEDRRFQLKNLRTTFFEEIRAVRCYGQRMLVVG